VKPFLILVMFVTSVWVCGCGTMAPRRGFSDRGNSISGLQGRERREGESRSLYSTKGASKRGATTERERKEAARKKGRSKSPTTPRSSR